MERTEGLFRWQWAGYARFHRNPTNLWIHLFTEPLFVAAALGLGVAGARLSWQLAALSTAALGAAIALQGKGHSLEQNPPEPFLGAGDFLRRLIAEQVVTFPRFVVSGGWRRSLAGVNDAAARASGEPESAGHAASVGRPR
jgi:hypothetical protein